MEHRASLLFLEWISRLTSSNWSRSPSWWTPRHSLKCSQTGINWKLAWETIRQNLRASYYMEFSQTTTRPCWVRIDLLATWWASQRVSLTSYRLRNSAPRNSLPKSTSTPSLIIRISLAASTPLCGMVTKLRALCPTKPWARLILKVLKSVRITRSTS